MLNITGLINKLDEEVRHMELGGNGTGRITAEELDQLSRLEEAAQGTVLDLSLEDMERVAAIRSTFHQQYGQISPAQLREKIEAARAAKDKATLFLLREIVPTVDLRVLASRLPGDTDTLAVCEKARRLQQRLAELERVPAHKRAAGAKERGQKPLEVQQPELSGRAQERYKALRSDPMYGM